MLLLIQEIDVPKRMLLRCSQHVHLHQDLTVVESVKFLKDRDQLLRVSESPNEHPAKVGAADIRYDPQLLCQ